MISDMRDKIEALKTHVQEASANPAFVHHAWFVKWHLQIVERIAFELLEYYPEADRDLVEVMVWMHDYGKILDFDHQYERTLTDGPKILRKFGFKPEFIELVIGNIEILDKKLELDIAQAPIEVQITSSADGCSHLVGPFMQLWWYENAQKPFETLMQDNLAKAAKDWDHKIVLPEARAAFERRHQTLLEQSGELPDTFL